MVKLTICYQIITEESANRGDFSETGIHAKETHESIANATCSILEHGPVEASSSKFHTGIWYTTLEPVLDSRPYTETTYTFHLDGATAEQELELYRRLIGED